MFKKLSEAELDVMLVIWNAQESLDTGEIVRKLKQGKKLQAVQVLLGRLVNKGYVSCEKIGRLNYYTPLVPQAAYRTAETETFVEKPLSKEDLEEIRALLDREEE